MVKSDSGAKQCRCRKSRCLKLYCECFAADLACSDACKCTDCGNSGDVTAREVERTARSITKIVRVPVTLGANSKSSQNPASHWAPLRSCNCKRSACNKLYCDCYQSGTPCRDTCRCTECKNTDQSALWAGRTRSDTIHNMPAGLKSGLTASFSFVPYHFNFVPYHVHEPRGEAKPQKVRAMKRKAVSLTVSPRKAVSPAVSPRIDDEDGNRTTEVSVEVFPGMKKSGYISTDSMVSSMSEHQGHKVETVPPRSQQTEQEISPSLSLHRMHHVEMEWSINDLLDF